MRALMLLSAVWFSACVSKEKYAQLESDYARLQSSHQALAAQNRQQEDRIAALDREIEILKTQDSDLAAFYSEILDDMAPMLRSGRLSIDLEEGRIQISAREGIMFDTGESELLLEGERVINGLARIMSEVSDRRFQIEGHADSRPINNAQFASNWELASSRAIAVTQALIDAGVDPTQLSAASYAEYQPVDTNETVEGMARNRRIDVVLVPDLSELEESQQLIDKAEQVEATAPQPDPDAPSM